MGDRIHTVAGLGAGNGGCAAAADLTNRGFAVHLFSRRRATLEPILERGGLELTGVVGEGFVRLARVTDRIDEAVAGADLIMTTTPIPAFDYLARILAPHLRPGQALFFNPGQAGGGLYFHRCLGASGGPRVRSVETPTLTYGTRIRAPGVTWIKTQVRNLPCGAFPGRDREELLAFARQLYPVLEPAENVLETALYDVNAVEHPPGVVCNAGWIETTGGNFRFYVEGLSPAVARVVEDVDAERLAIIRALNAQAGMCIRVEPFVDYFYRLGYTIVPASGPGSVVRQQQASPGNKVTKAPDTLDHRYMHEGIGYGLVPMREIAAALGVPTPLMDSLIRLASSLMGQDYFRTGLTLDRMGLGDRPVESWGHFLEQGYPD